MPRASANHELGSSTPSLSDLLRSFITYEELFDALNTHPEGDVRERFLRARALRAKYLGRLVRGHERAWDELQNEVKAGKADPKDGACIKRFVDIMAGLEEYLHRYSQAFEDDSKAADAPVVDRFFMDKFYRWHLEQDGMGHRGPNGELRSMYGSTGDDVPRTFMTPRGCDEGFFQRLILDKLTVPFNHKVVRPFQKYYNKLLGRNTELTAQGLSGARLNIVVYALECIVAVGIFEASIILVYNLPSTKSRLVAAPFASLACAIPVIFLSPQAKGAFHLIAGIWAVLIVIVFLSPANINSKSC